ncbi:AVT6A, partial [Symbiodinium necroappetens]
LEQKSYQRMQKVSTRAMLLCCVVYLMMGVTGFLAFGEDTLGNILGNLQPMLCANDWMVRSGMASMAFAVTMAYPLNIFPIRFSVETALFYHRPSLNCSAVRTGIAVGAVASSLIVAI